MSKKTKTTTGPSKFAQPYIMDAANTATSAYNQNAGTIQNSADQLTGLLPSLIDKYKNGNANVNAATDYNTSVLGGQYLDAGNPYLQQMIDKTLNDVTNSTQASLGLRGLTGGSTYADLISKNAANAALGMRYQDYSAERDRMSTAAGQSPGLAFADYAAISPALSVAEASLLPINAANQYTGSIGGLMGGYTTGSQKPGLGAMLMQGAQNAAAAYAGGG